MELEGCDASWPNFYEFTVKMKHEIFQDTTVECHSGITKLILKKDWKVLSKKQCKNVTVSVYDLLLY